MQYFSEQNPTSQSYGDLKCYGGQCFDVVMTLLFFFVFFCSVCSAVVFNSPTTTHHLPPQCHHGVFIGMFFLVSSFSKLCLYKSKVEYLQHLYRALKSRALSVSLAHLDVISRSHAHTSISHPLALFWKVTLLFWPSEVLRIAKFFPSLPLNCLVLIN